jgi:hypothetical protein
MLFAHRPEQTVIGPRRRPSGHGQGVKVAQHPEGLSFTVAPGGAGWRRGYCNVAPSELVAVGAPAGREIAWATA